MDSQDVRRKKSYIYIYMITDHLATPVCRYTLSLLFNVQLVSKGTFLSISESVGNTER